MILRRVLLAALLLSASSAGAAELRMAAASFPPSLGNPFTGVNQPSSEIWLSVFDALTSLGWGKGAEPALSVSWEATSPTRWVFRLRPGVRFHDGAPFDASSAAAVLMLLKEPENAPYLIAGEVKNIAGARALDPLTLEIVTALPDAILPKRLSVVMMIDPARWKRIGAEAYARAPTGTGPYRLQGWGPGDKDATLEAAASWRPVKAATRLRYRVIADHTARLQALAAGQVDVVSGLQVDDIAGLKEMGLGVHVQPNPQVKSIALRNVREGPHPLKDVRVRQALNYAVDKDAIARLIMLGTVTPAGQGVTPGTTGYNPDVAPYPHDPAKARRLLAEAGYRDGLALTFDVVTASATPDALIYQKIAQDLAEVGVKVDLQSVTFADYQSKYATGKWGAVDAFSQIWNNAAYQDPIRALEYFSCRKPNPFFCEPDLVPLLTQAEAEFDAARRERLLQTLIARLHDAAPAIWITNAVYVIGHGKRVPRIDMLPTGITFETLDMAP
jgi:peptide/nickel transport system substrate-binding protein